MNKDVIAFCFLAFGDEHINETNILIDNIKNNIVGNFEFYVATDDVNSITKNATNIIDIKEKFNYNHKRYPIEEALKKHNTILFIDSDHSIVNTDINIECIDYLDDGLYGTINTHYVTNDYLKKISNLSNNETPINNIFEHIFLLKLNDSKKKNKFIENWNHIFNETKNLAFPTNGLDGSQEGLIIHLSAVKSSINIIDIFPTGGEIVGFFNMFYHFCIEPNKQSFYKK